MESRYPVSFSRRNVGTPLGSFTEGTENLDRPDGLGRRTADDTTTRNP